MADEASLALFMEITGASADTAISYLTVFPLRLLE
jgi:hypothetical protein